MFSNFVAAISTATQSEISPSSTPRSSIDFPSNPDGSPRRSIGLSATSQLAESAISSLRKSIASQRVSSNSHPQPTQSPSRELDLVTHSTGRRKLSLEDRLRASLAKEAAENKSVDPPLPPLCEEIDPTRIPLPLSPPPEPAASVLPAPSIPEQLLTPVQAEERVETAAVEQPVLKPAEDLPRPRLSDPITPSKPTFSEDQAIHPPSTPPTPPARSPNPPATPNSWHKEQKHAYYSTVSSPLEPVHPEHDPLESSTRLNGAQNRLDGLSATTRAESDGPLIPDIPTAFNRLQAERNAADTILREFTPLESMSDAQGLRDHLQNTKLKLDVCSIYIAQYIFILKLLFLGVGGRNQAPQCSNPAKRRTGGRDP